MNQLLWDILTLTIYAFFPVTARILLQYAVDNSTVVRPMQGVALFVGGITFGAFIGMLCGLTERLAPMKEVAAAVAGFMAKDAMVHYLTNAAYFQKNPRALRTALLAWLSRMLSSTKKRK